MSSPTLAQQSASAPAQSRAVQFSIPAQPLPAALDAFIRASGWQVGYSTRITDGHRSTAVNGAMPPAQALRMLLAGTGINVSLTGANTATLVAPNSVAAGGAAPSGAIALDTIDVQGETAWGPVNGFVASRTATATKTDTPILEVPQSISVVTRDQIETRRNLTLNETLQYTPGVLAGASGQQQFVPRFQIRGFDIANGGSGGIYLNGLRSSTTWSDIEPYGLERVEVMRGPASVLYGQGQPSGVIGLVTKRPSEKPSHEVQLQGGSFEQRSGAFDFGGPMTEDRTLLYRFTGLLREGGNGIDFSNDGRAFLSGALTWRPTAATEITAYSLYQKSKGRWNYGLPAQGTVLPNPNGRIPLTRFIGEPDFDRTDTELTVAGYNLQHHATDSLTFRQNLQYSQEMLDYRHIGPIGLQADLRTLDRYAEAIHTDRKTFAVDNHAELRATTGVLQHTVLFGVDHRSVRYNDIGTWSGVVGPIDVFVPVYGQTVFIPAAADFRFRQTHNFTGIYVQDQIKLDRWILTLGGRHDWADASTVNVISGSVTDQNDRAFTKRAGLGYEFDTGVVPYVSYAESFTPLSGRTFDGSPLTPETGVQYEGGIKYQPKDMNTKRAGVDPAYRRALWIVVVLNLGFGVCELVGGFVAGSQALKADSLDFIGDGSITLVGLLALSWSAAARSRTALTQGCFLAALGIGVIASAGWRAFNAVPPEADLMGGIGVVALIVNVTAALVLARFRGSGDANARAIWLFSRNDALANVAVIVAAGLVAWTGSAWPDLVVAAVIALLFLHSAYDIIRDARKELAEHRRGAAA
ncbi:hypothetical protein NWI01_21930 [Nitrobacter winogradskyi]|uniref:Secretin/TonB short N-terminal domain-containing protein n=1 Tax=Nitrobacter winogradskyi TaxID=913 RepID=A0A4Y3WDS6_NITWI|nr:hypothetical protein NWI01_21930 [Nitrobacter winogradskyi]